MLNPFDEIARNNPELIDELYRRFLDDPSSVEEKWRWVFSGYRFAAQQGGLGAKADVQHAGLDMHGEEPRLIGIYDLVHTYRELGHAVADLDPLQQRHREHPLLALSEFGFSEADLDREFPGGAFHGLERATLREVVRALKDTYCSTIGVEFLDIRDKEQRDWLQERMEPWRNRPELYDEQRKQILRRLLEAESFEQYIHTKYVGAKRFSLEGGEALIPMLDDLIETAATSGADEIVLGMPHRGRLNVLAHTMRKPYASILAEFEGVFLPADLLGAGDVKYHLGYSYDYTSGEGKSVHLSLSYNPSHLEIINPVVEGMVRAKQDVKGDVDRERVVPVLLHGDAAFAGQGVVYETLMFSAVEGYRTGGTIHVIVNNQVGFTTDPEEGRSTEYASALAKVVQAPIFHVNGDDPEAAIHAGRMAAAFRQRFKKDVVIDLVCYRRHGHNELDDPTFTQPELYERIKSHPTVTERYIEQLKSTEVIGDEDVDALKKDIRDVLDNARDEARNDTPQQKAPAFVGLWDGIHPFATSWQSKTRIDRETVETVAAGLTQLPDSFTPHKRMPKMLEQLADMYDKGEALNWAAGELLAYGSLLLEGTPVRLSGQDSGRGTFSHRHAMLHDAKTGAAYVPLNHLADDQAPFEVLNSPLNEAGVLGFEYGYASVDPGRLVIWEAQFGDFANGAQVVIDQFIAAGESKWRRGCGLVLLLPHGYEGQGPEHSSARPERFLQLCAEDNMQVINPTTPAQIFHALRRQVHRDFRKPLVVMSPKSLLRHPEAVSPLRAFTGEDFVEVIADHDVQVPEKVERVLLCSGKVYFSLRSYYQELEQNDTALVRLEQLYPFPEQQLESVLQQYPNADDVCWVQEEPWNQGAWQFILPRVSLILGPERKFRYVGRPESASPAAGTYKAHKTEEDEFLRLAFSKSALPRLRRSSQVEHDDADDDAQEQQAS